MAQVTKMDMIQFLPTRKTDTKYYDTKAEIVSNSHWWENGKSSHISKIWIELQGKLRITQVQNNKKVKYNSNINVTVVVLLSTFIYFITPMTL